MLSSASCCGERILQTASRAVLKFSSGTSPFFLSICKPLNSKDSNSASADSLQPFTVGDWQVFPDRNELARGDQSIRLQPRLIQILRLLALTPGRTVSREMLLDRIWSRRMVNDEVLSRSIADLRQALGDDARQPLYLETIPKLGYRLIAAVNWLHAESAEIDRSEAPEIESPTAHPAVIEAHAVDSPRRRAWPLILLIPLLALISWNWFGSMHTGDHQHSAPDLQRAQPFSSEPGWELTPRFSHRGNLLIYSELDPQQSHARLRLRSRDGQVNRLLGESGNYDICPLFSPDDSEIAWVRRSAQGCEILRAPVLGGSAIAVASCASAIFSCPDWNGEWLVYTSEAAGADLGAGLSRVRLRDGLAEVLTRPAATVGDDTHPRVAADGRVLFSRGVEGERQLFIWSAADGAKAVPHPPSMIYGQIWRDDGQILAASDALGFRALVAIDPVSGQARLLGARGARFPDLAADGALVFEQASYDANLWWIAADGSGLRQLTRSQRYDAYPRLSPDGSRVLYQSNRDGPESLYLLDLSDGKESRLPLDPKLRWAQPAWSSDGKRLLLTRYTTDGTSLWLYTLGSDAPVAMTSLPAGAHDAQFDPDGVHGWYRSGAERSGPLLRFALDGNGAAVTVPGDVEHYQINLSGLFFTRLDDNRLQHCAGPIDGECRKLPIHLDPRQRRNWAIAAGAVYFVSAQHPVPDQITRYRLSDGFIDTLPWPRPSALSRAMDVDPQGRFAIIARTDRIDVDLMWVNPDP